MMMKQKIIKEEMKKNNEDENGKIEKERNIIYTL